MKTANTSRELINLLLDANGMDNTIVVQMNHGEGYFTHHKVVVQLSDHPAQLGPVIHIGPAIENLEKSNEPS